MALQRSDNPLQQKLVLEESNDGLQDGVTKSGYKLYKNTQLPPTWIEYFESVWACLFSWIPYFSFMFGWFKELPKKAEIPIAWSRIINARLNTKIMGSAYAGDYEADFKKSIRLRGIWNLRNVFDALTFTWVR